MQARTGEGSALTLVVDVRYHLASLVAVFLSLGLGILIGTSLAGDGDELERRDRWLTMLEREFDQVRDRSRQMEAALHRLTEERDRYAVFAGELVEELAAGRLAGVPVAVVTLGSFDGAGELVDFLREAGAAVVRRVFLEAPAEPPGPLLAGDGAAWERAGRALAGLALWGEPATAEGAEGTALFESLRVDVWGGGGAAECVVLLLGAGRPALEELGAALLGELRGTAGKAVAVVEEEGWRAVMEAAPVPYVMHAGSPMGKLSLLLLLSGGGGGAYGFEAGASLWPRELFAPVWGAAPGATGEAGM